MNIADTIMNKAIYRDDDFLVFEDMSVIEMKKNKVYGQKLNISKKEGFTKEYKSQKDSSLFNIVSKNEKDVRGYVYSAPYLQIKFTPQEEAEGDHRNIYIMHNGDVLIEDLQSSTMLKQKSPEEIYGLNVKALSRMMKKEFVAKNESKYKTKKGLKKNYA